MRTIRSIAIAGYILGILFKILHWPGANVLLVSSGVLLLISLGLLLVHHRGPITVQLRLPALLVGGLMAVVAGGLFKSMHWPGANLLLLLGLTTSAAWFLIPQGRRTVES